MDKEDVLRERINSLIDKALRNAIQLDVRENVRFAIEFFQKYQKSYL